MVRGSVAVGAMAAGLAGVLLLAGCAGGDAQETVEPSASATEPAPSPEASQSSAEAAVPDQPAAVAAPGAYIDYADFQQDPAKFAAAGDVVLFFNASWCPTCQAAVANFTSEAVPSGLTVVSVDYDDNTALRKQYGVTVQHTFVQVDPSGNATAKWTGSTSFDQVAAKTV